MTKHIELTPEQMDYVLELLRDPVRIVAMGLGPAVLDAAQKGGWKPPVDRAPNATVARGANVIAPAPHRPALAFNAPALRWAKIIERCARHPDGGALGGRGHSGLPDARERVEVNDRGPK